MKSTALILASTGIWILSNAQAAQCPTVTPKDVAEIIKPYGISNDPIPNVLTYKDARNVTWNVENLEGAILYYREKSFGVEQVDKPIETVTPHRRLPGVNVIRCKYKLHFRSEEPNYVEMMELTRIATE